jgi:hypothetical protein
LAALPLGVISIANMPDAQLLMCIEIDYNSKTLNFHHMSARDLLKWKQLRTAETIFMWRKLSLCEFLWLRFEPVQIRVKRKAGF